MVCYYYHKNFFIFSFQIHIDCGLLDSDKVTQFYDLAPAMDEEEEWGRLSVLGRVGSFRGSFRRIAKLADLAKNKKKKDKKKKN